MSVVLPRGNRTRLKDIFNSTTIPLEEGHLLNTSPPLDLDRPVSPAGLAVSEQRTTPSIEFSNGTVGIMDFSFVDDRTNNEQDDTAATAIDPMLSSNLAALSDDSSSVLSEVDDGASYEDDMILERADQSSSHDIDSEAETERLEISPQKLGERELAASRDRIVNGNAVPYSVSAVTTPLASLLSIEETNTNQETTTLVGRVYSRSPENRFGNGRIQSPPELAGHKRKRTGSILGDSGLASGTHQVTGNDGVRQEEILADFQRDGGTSDTGIADDEGSDVLSEVSSASDLTAIPDVASFANGAHPVHSSPIKDNASLSSDEEINSDHGLVDLPPDVDPLPLVKPEEELEMDEAGDMEVDEEEAEVAAKSEDELAKKKTAMDALVPIEKLFAIFRDRLFDQRLSDLSTELELLSNPNCTHPEYLAMRQCIDERREQKIQLENVLLFYKQKTMENAVHAARAQSHSQYFQTVRAIRERHTERLNELFCRTQKERRQIQAREPRFGYAFNPKRSKQIAHQTAYNKEVSLLSGIARHVGFPAAPELHGARGSEMEDDFRAMQMKPPGLPKPNFAALSANSRASEAAVEDNFFEKNPWAANPQLHAQSMLIDRPTPLSSRVPLSTPVPAQRNTNWMSSELQGSATSTLPASAEQHQQQKQPLSAAAQTPLLLSSSYRAGAMSNGNSSPFEQHTARRTNNGAPQHQHHHGQARGLSQPPGVASATSTPAPPSTTTTRFERPYKPKNIPPPSSSIFTPSPRGAGSVPVFMRGHSTASAAGDTPGSLSAGRAKDEAVGRYASPGGFTAVNGGSAASVGQGAGGSGASGRGLGIGLIEGFGAR